MKKLIISLTAIICCLAANAITFPQALYVKKGDVYTKYNFGVAGDLKFGNGGHTLSITGYEETINLDEIDYITFNAPVDATGMSPAKSKERMIQIGEELNSKVNINDQADIVRMVDQFVRVYSGYNLDPKYYDVHNNATVTNLSAILKSVGEVAKGNAGAIVKATQNGVELYQISDYYGVFVANTTNYEWEKVSDADYIEMRYPTDWGTCKVTLSQSAEYTDWTEVDFVGRIPHTITVVGSIDSVEKFKVVMTSEINNDAKSAQVKLSVTMQNGYQVDNEMAIYDTLITDAVKLSVNGETLITSNNYLHGQELTNYDNWKEDFENSESHDYYDETLGYWVYVPATTDSMLVAHVNYINSVTDILGKLQVKGHMASPSKIYDSFEQDSYLEESLEFWDESTNTMTLCGDNIDVIRNQALVLNNYADVAFYYDGTNQMQGYLAVDVSEEIDDYKSYIDSHYVFNEETGLWEEVPLENPYWEQYMYIELQPLLVFPDMTSFAIEDYFTATSFETLVNDYNAIIDTYYTISGNE